MTDPRDAEADPERDESVPADPTDSTPQAADTATPVPVERPVAAASPSAIFEPASSDIAPTFDVTVLPGAHRGGFSRLPTAPLNVVTESGAAEPGTAEPDWMISPPAQRGVAGWALGFAIAGLVVALFVGWGIPLGITAIVMAIIALRRPLENRGVAIWAMCLGALSLVYSLLWLWWEATRINLFG